MGRPDLAESIYRSVMLEAPDNVEAMIGVGTTLVSMQRGDEALLILDRSAKLEPKNAAVLAARGQYQEKCDFSDQRGGLGLDWQWHPQFTLHVHGLAGPGNRVLPQAVALIYVAQTTQRAGWDVSYRFFEFDSANVSVFSPGVKWLTRRTKVALRYALALTNFDGDPDADDGHTGSLDGAYRIQPRLWLNLGYVYGVDDFDTLSPDRIGRFKGHTARGSFRLNLKTLTSLIGRYDYQWREGDLTMQRIWVGISQSF